MALDNRQKAYLDAMGIDVWVRPQQQQAAEVLTPATVSDDNASPSRLLVNEKNVEVTQLPRETG
ncbi:MAG: hypothetical protein P8Y24_11930, partial [Gammaproteobacteria bacterium]